MSSKQLINLGTAPDSGTGDSPRRGGEKINTLFADIYANLGDNPVGNDPSQPFYGYRRPFFEYEYRVGEIHPAGRFVPITFKNPTTSLAFDATHGHGVDVAGVVVDTNGDGIPDIYEDSEWYFLSRGESVTVDLSGLTAGSTANLVLPLAVAGDIIRVRDSFSTWTAHKINVWTTPYEFTTDAQVVEWESAMGQTYPDDDSISIGGAPASYKSFASHNAGSYPNLTVSYSGDAGGVSSTNYSGLGDVELIFTYMGPRRGWLVRRQDLEAGDVETRLSQLDSDIVLVNNRINVLSLDHDSDLLSIESTLNSKIANIKIEFDSDTVITRTDHDSDLSVINNKITSIDSDVAVLSVILDGGTF